MKVQKSVRFDEDVWLMVEELRKQRHFRSYGDVINRLLRPALKEATDGETPQNRQPCRRRRQR